MAPLLALLVAGGASAHDADIIYAQARRAPEPDAGQVRERLTLTGATLGLLLPGALEGGVTQAALDGRSAALAAGLWDGVPLTAGGAPCQREAHAARVREGFIELTARFQCPPGPLRQTFGVLARLPANYRVVVGTFGDGEAGARFADAAHPEVELEGTGAGRVSGFGGWVGLGVKHIFEGVDHLAFLLALLLVGGTLKRVLLLVTSFTLAHSLTLGATALGFVALDPERARWVEAAIAVSIIYVAVENLVRRQHRHRVLVTFLFGLVHGFGFASVLRGYGLGDAVVPGLLGFNLGVEVGQAVVVAALLPLVRMAQRRPAFHLKAVRALSLLILSAGGYWLVERALG
ncbi:HupE/UreJ family protein [Myxococcaceae bacterium GXIMD 01537]